MHSFSNLQDIRLSYNTVKVIKNRTTERGAYGSAGYEIDLRGNLKKKESKKKEKSGDVQNLSEKIEYTEEEKAHPAFNAQEPSKEMIDSFNKQCKTAKKENKVGKERSYSIPSAKVRKRIATWAETKKTKKMLYFWTVTFPEKLNDNLCYKYFNNWLTRLRTSLNLKSYLWVVERQKNGTIHFHMLVNQIINVVTANEFMRTTLKNGRKKGEFQYNQTALNNYNGVDIAKDSSISLNHKTGAKEVKRSKKPLNFAAKGKKKALAKYLTKYITKNETTFTRLVWYCSKDISNLFTELAITIGAYNYLQQYTISEEGEVIEFENEYVKGQIIMREPPDNLFRFVTIFNNLLLDTYFS